METTTTLASAVSRHAQRLRETFRYVRSRTTRPQDCETTRNIAKACLSSEKSKAIEHVVAMTVDIARRGTAEDAEAVGLALVAIARAEWAAVNQAGPQMSVQEAQLAEEEAEGLVNRAEMDMAHNPGSATHALRYLSAASTHQRARRELDAAVRRQLATST